MTAEPVAPGAPAIILYRGVYRDDCGPSPTGLADCKATTAHEDDYFRIKILTEEGRKYADIEIPYDKEYENIVGIHARTIQPDGSITDFDGKPFTKWIVKGRGIKYLAKTFTLPNIQVGSIIEYFYTDDLAEYTLGNSNWVLSNELFTKEAKFALKPYTNADLPFHLHWINHNMPSQSTQTEQGPDQIILLEVSNIPAFPTEDYMPPADELKERVGFIYTKDMPETDPAKFWAKVNKRIAGYVEGFVGKPKAMEQAVSEIVGPNDPPEVKLQKLYARVQQMRNTSNEVEKTEEEKKREKEKEPANAEEAWKHGYANGRDLTWLYLALVRAAGFEAYGVVAANRAKYFFNPDAMESGRLDENVVRVKLNGKDLWFDPGWAFTPFGLLPWEETSMQGLQLDKKGSTWVPTLIPTFADARTERHADLTLSDTGDLEGKLTVTYTGLEAARLRLEERNADETARKARLENLVKESIPAACEVKLTNQPDWKNSALPLVAELNLKIPGWVSGAGRRVIVPVGLFSAQEKHTFDHAERVYPVYFEYPFMETDDINIQIPSGWQVSSLPQGWRDTGKVVTYTLSAQNDKGKIHLTRELTVNFIFLESKYYSALRDYFQQIKTTDEQQIVLEPGAARASN